MFEILCWSIFALYIVFKICSTISNRGCDVHQTPEQIREEEKAYLAAGITPPSWPRDTERYKSRFPPT